MSITLAQLAARFHAAGNKVQPVTRQHLKVAATLGVGLMKREIQIVHAVDTGAMLNSTTADVGNTEAFVGPTVKYAPYVALGTSRMAARPFHITAARKLEAQLDKMTAEDFGL